MRILEVCPYGMDSPGGVQGQVLALAREFSRRGHEVAVAAPRVAKAAEFLTFDLGRVVVLSANHSRAPIGISSEVKGRLRGAVQATGCQVVHIHEPYTPLVGPLACGLYGPFKVATFHRAGFDGWYRAYAKIVAMWHPVPSCAVAVSPAAAATARSIGISVGAIIPNGVDTAGPCSQEDKDPRLFVFVGRHEPRKGLAVLLHAWEMKLPSPDARLVVLGEGPETTKLKEQYNGLRNVEFLGRLTDDETFRWMQRAQVVVVPSTGGESFGMVLVEAMAAGAVVIASGLAPYRDVLGQAGKYFEPGSAESLAESMSEVTGSPELRAQLIERSRSRVVRFGIDTVADRYEEMFERGVVR